MGEMGVEEVELHVVVGPGFLVGESLLPPFDDVVHVLVQCGGAEEEHALAVHRRHAHVEGAVLRLLFQFDSLVALREHGPHVHLLAQVAGFLEVRVGPLRTVDTPADGLELFRQPGQFQRFHVRHLAPFVAPPSLHHHQAVQGLPADAVVGFEVVSGILHETLQLAGEEHFGEQGAVVVARLVRRPVAHGQREGGHGVCRSVQLQVERDGVERLIRGPDAGDGEGHGGIVVVVDEEEAVGVDAPFAVEAENIFLGGNDTIIQAFNEIDEYAKDITDPDTFLKNYDKPYKRLFKTIIVNIQQGKSLLTLLNIILSAKNNGFEVATISEIPNNREVWFSTNSLSIRVDIAEQIFQ